MKATRKYDICIFALATSLFIIGLSITLYGPVFMAKWYKQKLVLSPSSYAFKLWSHTPVPLFLEVYLFNWTNAEEFLRDKSVVPNFVEVGPFVFKEVHDKVNVVWNDNNTVTYNQTRRWNFVPELSEDLSVEVTNLNVFAATLSQILKGKEKFKFLINYAFDHLEHFYVTAQAKSWLFEGIDDKLMDYLVAVENIFKQTPFKKFAWFYGRNMSSSYDGIFTIKTGTDDIFNVGVMDKWNNMNQTNYFKNECAMVNGTSGELFPPMSSVQDNITIFISDICSSITLNYNGSSSVMGIESYKYVGGETTFDNGQFDPVNKCFCKDKCAPYGARDVSSCRTAPLFFSFPHFYLADETYTNSVTGMMPNESEHEFMIQLDPNTGIPTKVRAQLQINVRLEPVPWLNMFSDVPEIFIPMMWLRERAKISSELATQALLIFTIPSVFGYILLSIGLLIVTVRLFVVCLCSKRSADSELLIPPKMAGDEDE